MSKVVSRDYTTPKKRSRQRWRPPGGIPAENIYLLTEVAVTSWGRLFVRYGLGNRKNRLPKSQKLIEEIIRKLDRFHPITFAIVLYFQNYDLVWESNDFPINIPLANRRVSNPPKLVLWLDFILSGCISVFTGFGFNSPLPRSQYIFLFFRFYLNYTMKYK